MPHQEGLILESFHLRGNRVGLKRSLDAFSTVVFIAANMTATCWNFRRRRTQKENTRTNASKVSSNQYNVTSSYFLSLRTQGDRHTLNLDTQREVPNDGVGCLKLLYTHIPLSSGWMDPVGGTPSLMKNPVLYAWKSTSSRGALNYTVWCFQL